MELRSLKYIADACGATVLKGAADMPVSGVCTDSRQAGPGDLFFAIKGEKTDGHRFLKEAEARGVAGVVIARSAAGNPQRPEDLGCAVLAVENPRAALGSVAASYRADFDLPVVAVGGSNGKTTTKELIASVLRQKLAVLWSEASFNNDIGVPLTILRLERTHQVAVMEAGTNHPGELAPLVRMIRPRLGVITNVGREHLEFFGDLAGVSAEEGALAEGLPAGGRLFLGGDNDWAGDIARRSVAPVVKVGADKTNDWRVRNVRVDRSGTSFRIECPLAEFCGSYRIGLLGRHQALNALFAVAVGAELGLGRDQIERGLAGCQPPRMRMQCWEINGVRVLDDSYNANADSMLAALQALRDLPCRGRRVAVLGDMAELGPHSQAAHEEVGRRAAELGIGQLFVVGAMAPILAQAARNAGLNRVLEFAEVEAAAAGVKNFLRRGDLVLLKASRAARLERIAESLRGVEPLGVKSQGFRSMA